MGSVQSQRIIRFIRAASLFSPLLSLPGSEIFAFSVIRERDKLIVVPNEKERPKGEVLAESESEFFVKGKNFQLMFVRDRKGQVTHALLRLNGVEVRAQRIG